jgi:hypothetical protein
MRGYVLAQDPLNKEAAELMKDNLPAFKQCVQRSLRGGFVGGYSSYGRY